MARLSNSTRETMAGQLVRHRYAETGAHLVGESQDLFRQLYEYQYTTALRKHMAAIQHSIADAFHSANRLTANIEGRRIDVGKVTLGTANCAFKCDVAARPVTRDQTPYQAYIAVAADSPLGKRFVAFGDASAQLISDVTDAYREVLGALRQFSTGKRLAADWPEAMPVIGHLIPEDDRTLPVVQVAGLNSKFKLPPK